MTFKYQLITLELEIVESVIRTAADVGDAHFVIGPRHAFNATDIVNDLPALAFHLKPSLHGLAQILTTFTRHSS